MAQQKKNKNVSSTSASPSSKKASLLGCCFRFICCRILPLLVLLLAIFIGFLNTFEIPEGAFFAILGPIMKGGYLPPLIFGPYNPPLSPPVPDTLKPQLRPQNESFLELPGGFKIPQQGIGMCCRASAYDHETVRRTVLRYLLEGGRHIDTAHIYMNHKAVGEGIREAISLGVPRSEIFVTTKIFVRHFGEESAYNIVSVFQEQLGLEYIDLILMHAPRPLPYMNTECKRKNLGLGAACRSATWRGLSRAREEGLVRNIGVSNFNIQQMKSIQDLDLAPIANNQFQFNPWAPMWQIDVFDYCKKHNIVPTAYSSLGGLLSYSSAITQETLKEIAMKKSKTVAQVLLRWTIQKGGVIIPGTGNPKHMKENLSVFGFVLSDEEMKTIDSLRDDKSAQEHFYMKMDD